MFQFAAFALVRAAVTAASASLSSSGVAPRGGAGTVTDLLD